MRTSRKQIAVVAVLVAVGAAACSSSKKSATAGSTTTAGGTKGLTASAPGVTPTTIKIGFLTSVTGNAASSFGDSAAGAQARIAVENAKGGINGRKLELVVADDASSPTQDLTASQSLISKDVFGVVNFTPYAFGGYRALQQAGIPVTGAGFDGPEWGQQPNTNMFSVTGGITPNHQGATAFTTYGQFFKSIGATNVAGFAYGASPSSTASIKDLKTSVEAAGLKMGYENLSVPFGSVDFTGYALAMKQAGVDAAVCSCVQSSNLALIVAAKQGGVDLKSEVSLSGADSSVFGNATSASAAQGAYFPTTVIPLDLHNAASDALVANLKSNVPSYTGGYPSFGLGGSYLSMDLMIKGLQVAGQNPTRQSFITNLTNVTNYDAGGLLPSPVSFNHFGSFQKQGCTYFVQVKGNDFVTTNGGKPFCGDLLPGL
jgi:branched-chain amino acid transport system substrate-binding protein